MIQISVKVDGCKATPMEVSLTDDKVEDVRRRIPNNGDMYATSGGRTLKRSDELKSCGVRDGSTVKITSRMRGGGNTKTRRVKRRSNGSRNWTTGCVRWRASK